MLTYDASKEALFQSWKRDTLFRKGESLPEDAVWCECARLSYVPFEQGQAERLDTALGCAGFEPATPFNDPKTGTQAYGTRHPDGTVLVAFRGTQPPDFRDFLSYLGVSWTPAVFAGAFRRQLIDSLLDAQVLPEALPDGGRVHGGFLRGYRAISQQLDDWLRSQSPGRLVFTGHSLGAALATLAAHQHRAAAPVLVSFGSPRVGDAEFVATLAGLDLRRYVNCCDVVTRVPPELPFGYRHAGEARYIDREGDLHDSPGWLGRIKDQTLARAQFPISEGLGWAFADKVALRDLADHAPINYLRALAPELR